MLFLPLFRKSVPKGQGVAVKWDSELHHGVKFYTHSPGYTLNNNNNNNIR